MSETLPIGGLHADPGSFSAAVPPQETLRPARVDPESLEWAKVASSVSTRLAELPLEYERLMPTRVDSLAAQAEANAQVLKLQHAVMTTSLTAQAAVQLMSTTAQVANRMLNQQGG